MQPGRHVLVVIITALVFDFTNGFHSTANAMATSITTGALSRGLRYGLSSREVEELLAERGIQVDHVTVFRRVQRFTPLPIDAARPCRHAPGDRLSADETYVKIAGQWRSVYRAIEQFGQVIDVLVAEKRDIAATRRFFTRALNTNKITPVKVITDKAAVYPPVLDEVASGAWHHELGTEEPLNLRVLAAFNELATTI